MIIVTLHDGKEVFIDNDFVVTGDIEFSEVVQSIIEGFVKENIFPNSMKHLYLRIKSLGFQVKADLKDLRESKLPPGAVN